MDAGGESIGGGVAGRGGAGGGVGGKGEGCSSTAFGDGA
jgi:hypothetical protein